MDAALAVADGHELLAGLGSGLLQGLPDGGLPRAES